ncbi:hypothetical protein Scep_014421 [Stephania cephalantha]|uniref:Uncharacterized protein n=1 Tax=Stephania cephalantha TaxID=152367 RepID=A0AAP0P1P3_9MAGN
MEEGVRAAEQGGERTYGRGARSRAGRSAAGEHGGVATDQGGAERREGARSSGGGAPDIAQLRRRRRPAARDGAAEDDAVQHLAGTERPRTTRSSGSRMTARSGGAAKQRTPREAVANPRQRRVGGQIGESSW